MKHKGNCSGSKTILRVVLAGAFDGVAVAEVSLTGRVSAFLSVLSDDTGSDIEAFATGFEAAEVGISFDGFSELADAVFVSPESVDAVLRLGFIDPVRESSATARQSTL